MDTCTKTHESCKSIDKPLLPKRVLKIQDLGDDKFHVRLIETNQEYAIYAALSHCWGTEQSCTTTLSTLEARKHRISWSEIPKTFRDAITFAAKLDVRYIWIDSLCIIQDDATDWEIESSKMADVYQYAAVTLSATSSPGDTQGCFTENSAFMRDLEISLPEDVGACRIAVRKPLKHWNNLIPSQLLQHFPLLSRGWAFQERILAPRVLHFCESELVWECRQISTCECGGLGEDISPGGTYYNAIQDSEEEQNERAAVTHDLLDQLMAAELQQEEESLIPTLHERVNMTSTNSTNELSLPPPYTEGPQTSDSNFEFITPSSRVPTFDSILSLDEPEECPDIVRHFHRIVEQYSALRLTKPTDRLPALSGLCRRIQHLRGDYLAGLWSDSLCYDLLWRVNTLDLSQSNAGRPIAYRGPSWSWITPQSPVSYWDDILDFKSSSIPGMRQISSPSPGPMWMSVEQRAAFDPDQMLNYIVPNPSESLGEHPDRASAVVNVVGYNPFGQIRSGVLTVKASATTATLLYTYDSYWHGQTNKHDPARYKLSVLTKAKNTGYAAPDDSDIEVPFFADYALGIDGPHMIPTGALLALLLVHPKIALVLKQKVEGGIAVMSDGEQAWERVGIVRISEALRSYYMVDWMRASEVQKFKIV
jgi:hypothetical protein